MNESGLQFMNAFDFLTGGQESKCLFFWSFLGFWSLCCLFSSYFFKIIK